MYNNTKNTMTCMICSDRNKMVHNKWRTMYRLNVHSK